MAFKKLVIQFIYNLPALKKFLSSVVALVQFSAIYTFSCFFSLEASLLWWVKLVEVFVHT